MKLKLSRRKFITCSVVGSLGVGAAREAVAADAGGVKAQATLPKGKVAGLEISRLILGTNIITGHMHGRELRYLNDLSLRYNTDAKILETFALSEANGIDTFMTHHEPRVMRLLKQHRTATGGKMKLIVAPEPKARTVEDYKRVVQELVDAGADGIYVHGATTDPMMAKGKIDLVVQFVEIIKATGLPTGAGCHWLDSLKALEAAKAPCDFYVKTIHHHHYPTAPKKEEISTPWRELPPVYWCSNPEETIAFMKTVEKPWIGFKVMAAGAIQPRDAFRYAYTSGADFILAGMFDFQVAEDAAIANEVLAKIPKRDRPWRG
ncbi:MAG: hypothetical protein WCV00_04315 [Verrucomicrobiia bacterium]